MPVRRAIQRMTLARVKNLREVALVRLVNRSSRRRAGQALTLLTEQRLFYKQYEFRVPAYLCLSSSRADGRESGSTSSINVIQSFASVLGSSGWNVIGFEVCDMDDRLDRETTMHHTVL